MTIDIYIYIDDKKILCVNECIVKSEPYIVPAGPIADLTFMVKKSRP